jgi:hypothetical protein
LPDSDDELMEGGDRSLGEIVNNIVDPDALKQLVQHKTAVEYGHIRVKAWMLSRAITLDLLVRQANEASLLE